MKIKEAVQYQIKQLEYKRSLAEKLFFLSDRRVLRGAVSNLKIDLTLDKKMVMTMRTIKTLKLNKSEYD
jgi:hypothetical protein